MVLETGKWLAMLVLGAGCALAQTTVPDTPAGRTLQAWLDAFNSGDRAKMETYVTTIDQQQSVDGMSAFRRQTGGFGLLSIESSEPLHIRFRVKENGGPTNALGNLLVKDGQPPTVSTFGLRALPLGAVLENVTVDAAMRKKLIDGVATQLNEYYVDPLLAQMGFVAHTDALILDLRENGGGQPAMVTMIASYLFDKPTHLIDIYNRKEDSTVQNWTLSYLPGARLTKEPVFVLTAQRTFSGAEEFAKSKKSEACHHRR